MRDLAVESLELADKAIDEVDRLRDKKRYWHNAWQESKAREEATARKLGKMTTQRDGIAKRLEYYQLQLAALEDAVRMLMDVTECDGEGAESRELRKWVWNDSDTEAQIQAEGYQE
jgi:hypothetical protein